jgi:DNA-3-methyladenine glycosylase I
MRYYDDMKAIQRCAWAHGPEIYMQYHDEEWGRAVHGDRRLFEMINLESAQAGLSWLTVLKRREGYRKAFAHFDAKKIAKFDDAKRQALMNDAGIIRNRLKINAVIENAKAYLAIQKEWGSFEAYIWHFVNNKTIAFSRRDEAMRISHHMSKQLKKDGFHFVGPTICFAFMQAVGLVNDHTPGCFLHQTR